MFFLMPAVAAPAPEATDGRLLAPAPARTVQWRPRTGTSTYWQTSAQSMTGRQFTSHATSRRG